MRCMYLQLVLVKGGVCVCVCLELWLGVCVYLWLELWLKSVSLCVYVYGWNVVPAAGVVVEVCAGKALVVTANSKYSPRLISTTHIHPI